MRKQLCVGILIITMALSGIINCSASSLHETYIVQCMDNLAKYGLNIHSDNLNEVITRREAFELCYKLQNNNEDPYEAIITNYNDELALDFDFQDIKKYSKDYYFAQWLWYKNLLKGTADDGNLYARFDEAITYEEAITVILRALTRNGIFEISYDTLQLRYGADNTYYRYAEDIGLINTKALEDMFCVTIAVSDLGKQIPTSDFVALLDRALYLPSMSPGDYASTRRYYSIDVYMKEHANFLNGDINKYTLSFVGTRYDVLSSITGQNGQNPIIVEFEDGTKKIFVYDDKFKYPAEIYYQASVDYDDFSDIVIGTSTMYDVKKIDKNGNFAIPYSRTEKICSIHYTADNILLMVYYEAVEQSNTVSLVVSKIDVL